MQRENSSNGPFAADSPYSEFAVRTDNLAKALKIDVSELPAILGFSRSSLTRYRTGKSPISARAWHRLGKAEREAAIEFEPNATNDHAADPALVANRKWVRPELIPIVLRTELTMLSSAAEDLEKDSNALIERARLASDEIMGSNLHLSVDLLGCAHDLERSVISAGRWLRALEGIYKSDIDHVESLLDGEKESP